MRTSGFKADAGIGAGFLFEGAVNNTAGVNCLVETVGKRANAGIGAGELISGTVTKTIAVNCHVETKKKNSEAGIGVGLQQKGTITDTTAVDCHVGAMVRYSYAGIGGNRENNVTNTKVVNSTIESKLGLGKISGGPNPVICNVRIDGIQQSDTVKGCTYWPDNNFCAGIERHLITPNCRQAVDYYIDILNGANALITPALKKRWPRYRA